jgi:dephospho-CoA kinase
MHKRGTTLKVIALVGESGTGKSTIASYLESLGAGIIDTDAIGHQLLIEDTAVIQSLHRLFGSRIFLAGGEIDRNKLGAIVFNDAQALSKLNGILHPAILKVAAERVDSFRKAGKRLVVIDAALLLEVELPFWLDCVIALTCTREEQVRRLKIMGLLDEEIELRLKNQSHLEKSFHKADVMLDTGKAKEAVFAEVKAIVEKVMGRKL